MIFAIFVLMLIGLMVAAAGSYLPYFLDASSALFVLLPVFLLALGASSLAIWKLALVLPFRKSPLPDRGPVRAASATLTLMGDLSLYFGLLGFLIGFVLILVNLNDSTNLLQVLSVALLTVFYGLIFKLIFSAAAQRVQQINPGQ